MANDSPKLHGFTFTHQPDVVNAYWEPQIIQHRLSDGIMATYNKGYILKCELRWSQSWIDKDELSNVAVMYNQNTATAQYYPKPNTYATRKFNVHFVGGFDFVPHESLLQKTRQFFQGSILFESSIGEMTATASEVF